VPSREEATVLIARVVVVVVEEREVVKDAKSRVKTR